MSIEAALQLTMSNQIYLVHIRGDFLEWHLNMAGISFGLEYHKNFDIISKLCSLFIQTYLSNIEH